jgi:hypothetical protein
LRVRLEVTQRDRVGCDVCGAVYTVVRGRIADTEDWTGTFVAALHSHAAARELREGDASQRTRTAHVLVSVEVYADTGVAFMALAARIDATADEQQVGWESWGESPLRREVTPDARLEPSDVYGTVDAAVFARVAGAVSDLPDVAQHLGF